METNLKPDEIVYIRNRRHPTENMLMVFKHHELVPISNDDEIDAEVVIFCEDPQTKNDL